MVALAIAVAATIAFANPTPTSSSDVTAVTSAHKWAEVKLSRTTMWIPEPSVVASTADIQDYSLWDVRSDAPTSSPVPYGCAPPLLCVAAIAHPSISTAAETSAAVSVVDFQDYSLWDIRSDTTPVDSAPAISPRTPAAVTAAFSPKISIHDVDIMPTPVVSVTDSLALSQPTSTDPYVTPTWPGEMMPPTRPYCPDDNRLLCHPLRITTLVDDTFPSSAAELHSDVDEAASLLPRGACGVGKHGVRTNQGSYVCVQDPPPPPMTTLYATLTIPPTPNVSTDPQEAGKAIRARAVCEDGEYMLMTQEGQWKCAGAYSPLPSPEPTVKTILPTLPSTSRDIEVAMSAAIEAYNAELGPRGICGKGRHMGMTHRGQWKCMGFPEAVTPSTTFHTVTILPTPTLRPRSFETAQVLEQIEVAGPDEAIVPLSESGTGAWAPLAEMCGEGKHWVRTHARHFKCVEVYSTAIHHTVFQVLQEIYYVASAVLSYALDAGWESYTYHSGRL